MLMVERAQAIGADVSLTLFDGTVEEGIVVGLDKVHSSDDKGVEVEKEVINLLLDDNFIRTFPILELERFTFKDATLRHDLQHLLDVLLNANKKDLKKLTIFAKVRAR
jgi:poly(3-hydroxyalkanoate) synthetase